MQENKNSKLKNQKEQKEGGRANRAEKEHNDPKQDNKIKESKKRPRINEQQINLHKENTKSSNRQDREKARKGQNIEGLDSNQNRRSGGNEERKPQRTGRSGKNEAQIRTTNKSEKDISSGEQGEVKRTIAPRRRKIAAKNQRHEQKREGKEEGEEGEEQLREGGDLPASSSRSRRSAGPVGQESKKELRNEEKDAGLGSGHRRPLTTIEGVSRGRGSDKQNRDAETRNMYDNKSPGTRGGPFGSRRPRKIL